MSAADRLRSWRSADKNKSRANGEVRSGGPQHKCRDKARKNVRHGGRDRSKARKQMQIRSKVGSAERAVISSQSQSNGPQSRMISKTHQTQWVGGEWGADANEE